ncbi:RasGEF [Dinochytrium kinnereticum]|nr:RasGEF [Dinochytrium kinnereticum]
MSTIIASAMPERQGIDESATTLTTSTITPPTSTSPSIVKQISRSNSIGSFTSASSLTIQAGPCTPLQLLQKKVSMGIIIGGNTVSRQQSFSVPDLKAEDSPSNLPGAPGTVSFLSPGQPLKPHNDHIQRSDSEKLGEGHQERGKPVLESKISAEFLQETLDSVADLLRPSTRGGGGAIGSGRDLFFRPASFQLDPSLKPTDVGLSATSFSELTTSSYNDETMKPAEETGTSSRSELPIIPVSKREGFMENSHSSGHPRSISATLNRLESNLSGSDILSTSISSSFAPTSGNLSSHLATAMSNDDYEEEEAASASYRPGASSGKHIHHRQESLSHLSTVISPGTATVISLSSLSDRKAGDRMSTFSTVSSCSTNTRNSLNLDKDFDMLGGSIRPRTASLSSNSSLRTGVDLVGVKIACNDTIRTVSPSLEGTYPPEIEDRPQHSSHAAVQSCPSAATWRSVGSLSDNQPAGTTVPGITGRSQQTPRHAAPTPPPAHVRRQSEGGVLPSPGSSSPFGGKAIPLTAAASSPNFAISSVNGSTSSLISSTMGSLPHIELPQRPRLGPFYLTQERYNSVQSSMDSELFAHFGFAVGPRPTQKDFAPPSVTTAPLTQIGGGDGPGMTVGRPDLPVLMEDSEGRNVIRGGTLPTLVNLLSAQGVSTDADFMMDFLKTYRYFADALDVARLLMLRYIEIGWLMEGSSTSASSSASGLEKDHSDKKGISAWYSKSTSSSTASSRGNISATVTTTGKEIDGFLQLRVLNVFKKWIEGHPDDFSRNPQLHDLSRLFLDRHVKLDPKRILFVASILKNLEERAPLIQSPAASTVYGRSSYLPSKLNMVSTASSTSMMHTSSSQAQSPLRSRTASEASSIAVPPQSTPLTVRKSGTIGSTGSLSDHRPRSGTIITSGDEDDTSGGQSVGIGGLNLRRGSRTSAPSSISLSLALSMLEPPKMSMSDLDPTLVAQQLTLIEHNQFRRIRIEEFYCQAWNNQPAPSASHLRPKSRLGSLIAWFNRVAYGVASEVVMAAKVKDRVGVLKRFIFIAHLCLKWNNFNTVFEIVAGLNLGAITRLKKTWKALPSKYWDVWNTLNRTVSDEGSYRVYRHHISALKDRKPESPLLPYLGVNLKDLTFAEDGNPTHLSLAEVATTLRMPQQSVSDEKVINFTKFRMISKLLDSIVATQKGLYDFKADEKVQMWLKEDWVCLETAELYEQSKICEPRVPVST